MDWYQILVETYIRGIESKTKGMCLYFFVCYMDDVLNRVTRIKNIRPESMS